MTALSEIAAGLDEIAAHNAKMEAEADAEIARIEALWGIARKTPRRPIGWPRRDWFRMSMSLRREHYHCCWLDKPPAGPSTAPLTRAAQEEK